jgi:hypothetical protein
MLSQPEVPGVQALVPYNQLEGKVQLSAPSFAALFALLVFREKY